MDYLQYAQVPLISQTMLVFINFSLLTIKLKTSSISDEQHYAMATVILESN